MKTSIATVPIAGAGFHRIEIVERDFIADEGCPREIGRLIRDHGLKIALFQPFRDFEGLTGALSAEAFDPARHKFDTMAELGTDLMPVCSSVHPEALGGIGRVADDPAPSCVKAAIGPS